MLTKNNIPTGMANYKENVRIWTLYSYTQKNVLSWFDTGHANSQNLSGPKYSHLLTMQVLVLFFFTNTKAKQTCSIHNTNTWQNNCIVLLLATLPMQF